MINQDSLDNNILNCIKDIDQDQLNATQNCRADNVHRLFQYPAMMVPMTQEVIISIFRRFLPSNGYMIDPFMGSATSLIISMKLGLNCYGQDINPLAVLLSKVKTGPLKHEKFNKALTYLKKKIGEDSSSEIEVSFNNIDKWFEKDVQIELSKLRRAIKQINEKYIRRFFWVVLAETIRLTSNDRTSTYKLHQRPLEEIKKRNFCAISEFEKLTQRSISDIQKFSAELEAKGLLNNYRFTKNVRICWGNTAHSIDSNLKYNLLVSSPPYGDNHTTVTYGQHAYLPLQWIDLNDIDEKIDTRFLKTTQEIDRISLGGITSIEKTEQKKEELFRKTLTLKNFYSSFAEEEYFRLSKTISFISDFDNSLDNILEKLTKNAYLIWTIGNRHVAGKELKNDKILIELLEKKGVKFISDVEREILCKRMPSRNNISKTMSKEKILIFRKPF